MTEILESTTAPTRAPRGISTAGDRILARVRRLHNSSSGDATVVGVFGFLIAFAFSWVPSIWYDESATIVSATRTWAQLWREIHTVDAVHATYYFSMHVWFSIVGYSPIALRLPSAVAVGIAGALVVMLATALTSKRTGLVAGLVFILLPRVTWAGGEGRSYATATALATALTLVFVHASQRRPDDRARFMRWWALYGFLALASTAVFLYSALLVVAHGITLLLWARRSRRDRRVTPVTSAFVGWAASAAIAGVTLMPLARLSLAESGQVSWIPRPNPLTIYGFFVTQWFTNNIPFAVFGWGLIVAAVILVVRKGARHVMPNVLQVTLPWILVPALGLIAASFVTSPLYSPRYVTFGAPAVAILMAVALTSIRRRALIAGGVVLSLLLSAPTWVAQREPEAKDMSSWKKVAALVEHERKLEGAGANDAVIYGTLRRHPTGSARSMMYSYPGAFSGTTDVTIDRTAADAGTLWETRYPLDEVVDRVEGHEYVWLITSDKNDERPEVTGELAGKGYHVDEEWHFSYVNVVRYER